MNGSPKAVRLEHTSGAVRPTPAGQPVRRVLIVEDDDVARVQLQQLLRRDAFITVDAVGNAEDALQELSQRHYSIVLTDLRLPRSDGMELIREIQKRSWLVTVIVITGQGSIDDAVAAIRLGAYDFLCKPINIENLRLVMDRAFRDSALKDEVSQLRSQLQEKYSFFHILSKNPKMHAVFELIGNLAHTNTTVLIEGETGTGKEQVARAIHQSSTDRVGPLVAVNCAALPETLLESELFGHEKGSFTSAVSQRKGRFEMAEGGTLFLDEVGDFSPAMQAKLLRVLQERRYERVGGTESIGVNVRVVTATNRSLALLVKQGKFREDLFYRLNVVKIELPPLRDRPEDIPLLATHFAEKFTPPPGPAKKISPAAMEILMQYQWPGNIRELENVIERACVTTRKSVIESENLPTDLISPVAPRLPVQIDLERPLPDIVREAVAAIERQFIQKALRKAQGHVGRCAKICGMSRRSITTKIAEYKLDKTALAEV